MQPKSYEYSQMFIWKQDDDVCVYLFYILFGLYQAEIWQYI